MTDSIRPFEVNVPQEAPRSVGWWLRDGVPLWAPHSRPAQQPDRPTEE
jgi:hypothetical protein